MKYPRHAALISAGQAGSSMIMLRPRKLPRRDTLPLTEVVTHVGGGQESDAYAEILEQYFIAKNVAAGKRRPIFLSSCGTNMLTAAQTIGTPKTIGANF